MPGVKAITTCRECGEPRDPKCRMALCVEHARAFRKAQSGKHHMSGKPQAVRLQEAYARLRIRALLDAVKSA